MNPNDLLNPANPLSPLNPISPMNPASPIWDDSTPVNRSTGGDGPLAFAILFGVIAVFAILGICIWLEERNRNK